MILIASIGCNPGGVIANTFYVSGEFSLTAYKTLLASGKNDWIACSLVAMAVSRKRT
jgi:hypothetical protein